ncbi:MAG: conserved rane protein of unknown function [Modestobacter sp.]|nr:conserved rane protein of unknown function [Modestobacter sp.]
MLANIGYAAAYTGIGILLLVLGGIALDLLTPGRLARHIYEERSINAGIALAAGFLGQGAIAFTTIWTNATSGFGTALGYTVVFGVLGVLLQVVAFLVLDLLTPGKLGETLMQVVFHPASLVTAAATLAVSAIIVASIWP